MNTLRGSVGRGFLFGVLGLATLLWSFCVAAQTVVLALPADAARGQAVEPSVHEWLSRMQEASRRRAFVGTFVVAAGSSLTSSRIWHVCEGAQQVERVESLTGAPRTTFRHNDVVRTFLPERRIVLTERRESLALFPNLLQSDEASITQNYRVKARGSARVAGLDVDVVLLQPKDDLRFGYQVWTERSSGLVIKLQTLNASGQVLEQSAFSELQLNAPLDMAQMIRTMGQTEGYQMARRDLVQAVAAVEGWVLKTEVAGYKPLSCYKRTLGIEAGRAEHTLQWMFSDGLASVSLFIEAFDPRRHRQAGSYAMGATHSLTRRMGDWWLTVVGEVPAQTLLAFAQGLERNR